MNFGHHTCNPFITLRCNYRCPYCITRFAPDFKAKQEEHVGWVDALNSLEDVDGYIFNGGEPTLHIEFLPLMHGLKKCRLIAIGTNAADGTPFETLRQMPTRKEIIVDISYHPREEVCTPALIHEADLLADRAKAIHADTGNRVCIHAVDWPGYRDGYYKAMLARIGERSGIETFIQEFEGWHDGRFYYSGGNASMVEACSMQGQQPCTCYRTVFTPIGPTGDVYFCHSLMYAGSNFGIIGNVFDGWIDPVEKIRCDRFGWCNPCDKRRIDRP
jgi:hypothetical protein